MTKLTPQETGRVSAGARDEGKLAAHVVETEVQADTPAPAGRWRTVAFPSCWHPCLVNCNCHIGSFSEIHEDCVV